MNGSKYTYKIFYDLDLDIWNWVDGTHVKSHGEAWRDNLRTDDEKKLFDLVADMTSENAKKYLSDELPQRYKCNIDYYNSRQREIDRTLQL